MRRIAFVVVWFAGCYHPAELAVCTTRCGADQLCPDGQACGTDGRCHAADGLECSQLPADASDTPRADAAPDCFGGGAVPAFQPVCDAAGHITEMTRVLAGMIDTATVSVTNCDELQPQASGAMVCVVVGFDVVVTGSLVAAGPNPLAIIAVHDLTIQTGGSIDVGSYASTVGPGLTSVGCGVHVGGNNLYGGGGGAGGSFQGAGGPGGAGDFNAAVAGGTATSTLALPAILRGGCAGSAGGSGTGAVSPGGEAGGAVYLIAGHVLAIEGVVGAGGHGGLMGGAYSGGGGGGSGGMIALEAPTVTITGQVFANGGGGTGGSGGTAANPGGDARTAARASGGQGTVSAVTSASGGYGGYGSVDANLAGEQGGPEVAGQMNMPNAGGAGGGGGAGFIIVHGAGSGTTSPPYVLR